MTRIIITAGDEYADIDILACGVAYQELLTHHGINAMTVLTCPFSNNVTQQIQAWDFRIQTSYTPQPSDRFVIVDLSNPHIIADFVDQSKIVEVYDHHPGFEEYWRSKLGNKARIELIGACATLIWEEINRQGYADQTTPVSANLLSTAIVSNTLNFNAQVTNIRDRNAYEQLKIYTTLSSEWIPRYYEDQTVELFANPREAIKNDTKKRLFPDYGIDITIGQIELWEGRKFVEEFQAEIREVLESFGTEHWFMTIPSIHEGYNYLLAGSQTIKDILRKKIDAEFNDEIGITPKLWLRKEIVKRIEA